MDWHVGLLTQNRPDGIYWYRWSNAHARRKLLRYDGTLTATRIKEAHETQRATLSVLEEFLMPASAPWNRRLQEPSARVACHTYPDSGRDEEGLKGRVSGPCASVLCGCAAHDWPAGLLGFPIGKEPSWELELMRLGFELSTETSRLS